MGRDGAESLGILLERTFRLVRRELSRELERLGESLLVWRMLACLRERRSVSQADLASQIGQSAAGVSRLLDVLDEERLVRRSRHARDLRKRRVELSERGRRRLARVDQGADLALWGVFAALSDEEKCALTRLLSKLLDAPATAEQTGARCRQ